MDEDNFGGHSHDVPYSHAYITVDDRRYEINPDGTWSIRTFEDCFITFNNYYGGNAVRKVEVSKTEAMIWAQLRLKATILTATVG